MTAASELATLVADLLGTLDAWQRAGATVVPGGALEGLPDAPRFEAPVSARGASPASPRPSVERPFEAPRAPSLVAAPRPTPPPPTIVRTAPPPAAAPASPPAPLPGPPAASPVAPPPSSPPAGLFGAAPESAPGAGLFGARWAHALRDRRAEIDQFLAAAGPCPACGAAAASRRGSGQVEARLAVVAADPRGASLGLEGVTMLDKMFVHVLSMERTDAWLLEANACAVETDAGCRTVLLKQLEIVGPRLVLAMGGGASLLGLVPDRGRWQRWQEADVLPTWHPHELLVRPADKRGAMEHLTQIRQRM